MPTKAPVYGFGSRAVKKYKWSVTCKERNKTAESLGYTRYLGVLASVFLFLCAYVCVPRCEGMCVLFVCVCVRVCVCVCVGVQVGKGQVGVRGEGD